MTPELLTEYTPRLTIAWQSLQTEMLTEYARKNRLSGEVTAVLKDYLAQPGKFIRPMLTLFLAEVYGRQPSRQLERLALSLEILHLYLLIHDDIMDQSDRRRGGPSLHRLFEAHHRALHLRGDAVHFGESLALLVGDLFENKAEELWTEAIAKKVIPAKMRQQFDQLKDEVYWGQFLDVRQSIDPQLPPLEHIIQVMREKTGRYSIYRPMQLGVLAAGTTEPTWIAPFAEAVGLVYQLTDDILGTFGDQTKTGKSIDADIQERKLSPLVYFAFEEATGNDYEKLTRYYLKDDATIKPPEIKTILARSKAKERTQALAADYYHQATAVLEDPEVPEKARQKLANFAQFILNRDH